MQFGTAVRKEGRGGDVILFIGRTVFSSFVLSRFKLLLHVFKNLNPKPKSAKYQLVQLNVLFRIFCHEHNSTTRTKIVISNNDNQHFCAVSYLHKHYEQSETGVDFVRIYEKIGASSILMNDEIPVNFLLRRVYTQIHSAQV